MSEEQDILNMIGGAGGDNIAAEMSASAYNNMQQQEPNLIQWQLELDNILERIEHLFRGSVLKENKDTGELEYVVPEDKDLVIMNEYGVQLIMNILNFYLNRNTILSNYKEERVYEILRDLGEELADLIYINYEKMGLDSIQKKSRSNVLVMNILHMVESAYNRSLRGGERDSMRTARVVTQTQPLGQQSITPMQMPQSRGFSLNPFKGFRK